MFIWWQLWSIKPCCWSVGFGYLHDISHDDTVHKLWCDTPGSESGFGCMLSQVCCTVILQHATIGTEWSALGTYNKYSCRETEHFSTKTRTSTPHWETGRSQHQDTLQRWLTQPVHWDAEDKEEANIRWIKLDRRDKRSNYFWIFFFNFPLFIHIFFNKNSWELILKKICVLKIV